MSAQQITIDRSLLPHGDAALTTTTKKAMHRLFEPIAKHINAIIVAPNVHTASLMRENAPPGSALRGYVLQVSGDAKAKHVLDDNFGHTVLAFPVVGAADDAASDNEFFAVDEARVVSQFKPSPLSAAHPGIDVGLYATSDGLDKQYVVVSRGNSAASVRQLLEHADHSTIDELYADPIYTETVHTNARTVEAAARLWAANNGLRLAKTPTVETRSFILEHDKAASVDPAGAEDKARNVYLYYNDVVNTGRASGGVLVDQGVLGGMVEVRAPSDTDGQGRRTFAWVNPLRNLMPANTGAYVEHSGRRPAVHYTHSERAAQHAASRVKWDGPLTAYNHSKERQFNSIDNRTIDWINKLGGDSELTRRTYTPVIVQPHAVRQEGLSLRDLMLVSRGTPTVTVPVNNPVVSRIVANWNELHPLIPGYNANDLGKIFARQSPDGRTLDIDRVVLEVAPEK